MRASRGPLVAQPIPANKLKPPLASQITSKLSELGKEPTGAEFLSWTTEEFCQLGVSAYIAKKIDTHLKDARVSLAQLNTSNEDAATGNATDNITPSAVAVQEAAAIRDMTTGRGTTGAAGGNNDEERSKRSRQPRLSALPAPEDMMLLPKTEPQDDAMATDDEDQEEQEKEEEEKENDNHIEDDEEHRGTRHGTRLRGARLRAIERAFDRIAEVEAEVDLDEYQEEGDVPTDSDDEEPEAIHRGRRHQRRAAARNAEDTEEEVDDAPEEPDDGLHPKNNNACWEDTVFEGLEDILKLMTFEELKHLVDEQLTWPAADFYHYKRKNEDGVLVWKNRSRQYIAHRIVKMILEGTLSTKAKDKEEANPGTWEAVDDVLDKFVEEKYIKQYIDENLKLRFATPPKISNQRSLLWRLWSKPKAPLERIDVSLGRITFPVTRFGPHIAKYWEDVVEAAALEPASSAAPLPDPYLPTSQVLAAFRKSQHEIRAGGTTQATQATAMATAPASQPGGLVKPEPGTEPDHQGPGPLSATATGQEERMGPDGQRELVFPEQESEDDTDWNDLFQQVSNMQRRGGISLHWRLDLKAMKLSVEIVGRLKEGQGEQMVDVAWLKRAGDSGNGDEFLQVFLEQILANLDHLKNSQELSDAIERVNVAWDAAVSDLEERRVPTMLEPPHTMSIGVLDRIMAGVEDLDRALGRGVEKDCHEHLALKLKPYQKRALSYMMKEETAPGGTARHLWIKVPLPPGTPENIECYASPSLFKLFISRSPTASTQVLGLGGGAGWQALEMGMGKTAVIIAGIMFNPPPHGWRANRPWKAFDPADYLTTKTENMPRGGTLVIVPTTLVRQWELEIIKTLDSPDEMSVLRWTDKTRTLDCNEIALYDCVITTPQQFSKTSTLASVYWHRIVIDEAQVNAGSAMESGLLYSTHRWIVSGTPVNAQHETLSPSLTFLRLGGYSDVFKYIPASMATIMRAMMVRYTKNGTIDGEKNLDLLPIVEKVINVTLNEYDQEDERAEKQTTYIKFRETVNTGAKKSGVPFTNLDSILENREQCKLLETSGLVKRARYRTMLHSMRGIVGGGHPVLTDEMEINERTGLLEPKKRYFQSKAQAVVACLERLRRKDPEAKVLIFSEFEENLRSIARMLPEINMDHRAIFGGTSAKKRGEAIEQFMSDPPTRVFLLTAKVGAVGVTLTAATHVFICEPLMNPSLELQAIGRSQRMGQTKQVTVTRLYSRGTVEERVRQYMARRHTTKMTSTAMAVNSAASDFQQRCNLYELNELIKCELDEEENEEEDGGVAAME